MKSIVSSLTRPAVALALAGSFALSACGGGTAPAPAPVDFAQQLTPLRIAAPNQNAITALASGGVVAVGPDFSALAWLTHPRDHRSWRRR